MDNQNQLIELLKSITKLSEDIISETESSVVSEKAIEQLYIIDQIMEVIK